MKRYICVVCCVLALVSAKTFAQSAGTEGKDFWVTFLSADRLDEDDKKITLSLSISTTKDCQVTLENPYTGYNLSRRVTANQLFTENLYSGTAKNTNADKAGCYTIVSEQPLNTAIHITSTENISVYASNFKDKSFDATNVLPTTALTDNYLIQTYPASDHDEKPQGSHFAIIATEDNTIVDIALSTKTDKGRTGTITTPSLKQGQVYYVWTGKNEGAESDLSGTKVTARDGKRIAVFQGNPHTNLPYYKDYGFTDYANTKDRDHLFSQAIPTAFWGTRYALTASMTRKRDIIRVMAINDGTEVRINGTLVHTFDFSVDTKQYWEFEMGQKMSGRKAPLVQDNSCFLETSCPTSVHLFMTSNKYDGSDKADPAMVVINPIEQGISHVTFTTYGSSNTHYVNIVTEKNNCKEMTISYTDGGRRVSQNLEQYFEPVTGSNERYWFARLDKLDTAERPYTLEGKRPFVAHAYGYGERESYGYSVGSAAVEKSIIIDGNNYINLQRYDSLFCIGDTIEIEPYFSVDVENVTWSMGDGVRIDQNTENQKSFKYAYESPGWYDLKAITHTVNQCDGSDYRDTVTVVIHVLRPDTVRMPGTHDCINENETERGVVYPFLEIREVKTDCSRVEITPVEIGVISSYTIQEDTVAYDSCYWINSWRYVSGDYTDTIPNGNYMNCDSIITRHITIVSCLGVEVEMPQAEFCADEQNITLNYKITKGDPSQLAGGYILLTSGKKIDVEISNNQITAPISEFTPGKYSCMLCLEDKLCEKKLVEIPLSFTIRYASNIFRQKWDDVLVVPNSSTNGGFEFIGYQWLKDGEEISGATTAWYYAPDYTLETKLDTAAEYSVRLMTKDSVIIESCTKKPQSIGEATQSVRVAPTLLMPRENISIETEGEATAEIYNTLGLRESISLFKDKTEISAPREKGIYVLQVTLSNGYKTSKQIVVGR
ncbi:MAG: T9SS type A sorting domain-containing protein [Paludibacteraceae bacterium]|nr:T9SS type A sorting domain-containing protein [Paludibacteraceae bacterium]